MLILAQNNEVAPIPGTSYYALGWVVTLLGRAGVPAWAVRDGLRLKAQQWDAWVKHLNGGPAADDPTRPWLFRLPHCRGIALDIDPSFNDEMQQAGFWRPFFDPVNPNTGIPQYRRDEPWHYEPKSINIYDFPIVESIPDTAGSGGAPIDDSKEWDEMASEAEVQSAVDKAITARLNDIAGAIWQYGMDGGAKLPDGRVVPRETAGARLREVRRSTFGLYGRVTTLATFLKRLVTGQTYTNEQVDVIVAQTADEGTAGS